jgi:hypothetical protein
MQTIKTYLYDNTVTVQILDTSIFTTRNRQVYSRPIKVYQGIDNPIQVLVRNQDQKKVDLTGYSLQADIQDPSNQITVNSYAVTFANIALGQGTFTIDKDTLDSLEQRFYKLTFKTIHSNDNTERPIYIDDNYGVPLDLQVLPAYYSSTEAVPMSDNGVADGGLLRNQNQQDPSTEPTLDGGTIQ